MENGITQFGIDELARQGVNIEGLVPGYPMTDDMRLRLGIQDDVDPGALPDPVAAQPTMTPPAAPQPAMDPAAASAAMASVSAPAPVMQAQLQQPEGGGIMDTIFGPKGETDQFSNLNRSQRMMLAFGAMRDAGMALQGKDSSAFTDTLRQINAQSDMRRKAAEAEQLRATEANKQAAINQLLGGSRAVGGAATGEAGAVDAKAQLAQLESQMGAFAQMGQMDFYTQKRAQLIEQIEAEAAAAKKAEDEANLKQGKIAGYEETISVAEEALMASGGFNSVEDLRKAVEANNFDPSSFILSRQNFWPDSPAFKDFQSAANQFAAIMTFQNLGAITAQGIKLGTLSDADLKIIANQSGEIDPINRPQQTARNILQVYKSVSKTLKEMSASGDAELDAMLKKYNIEG